METLEPKLRFPEFDDDWNNFTLEQLTDKVGDGLHGTPEYVDNSDVYFINGNNLIDGKIVISETSKKVSLETFTKNDKGLNSNSILISINGTIGSISRYNNEKIMLGKSVGYFNFKQSKDFYFHILQSNKVQDYFVSELTGSTIKNLSLKTLRETNIYQPSLVEQTKIANFLSSVDEKLNLLKEKKTLLEDYKKGIMQKIFNQDIRFKDDNGNDFEDWIETNLGAICEFENGKAHENEIDENGDFIVVNSKFVSTNGRVRKYTNKIISRLDKYDIVMVMSDVPNGKAIAKCYYIEEDNKYSLNQRICKIRIVNNDSKYIYYLINRNPYYLAFDSGVGQTNLRKDEVLDCPLYIPKDIKEQTKIANFLSAIDEKIELVSNQIQDTQEYKKGLLQQMFV